MVMGKGGLSESFLELPPLFPPHHLVKDKGEAIEVKTREIEKMAAIAAENLRLMRGIVYVNLNKNRADKAEKFKAGEIVFAVDRYVIPGNSRPLKTKFFPSPYIILETKYTTCLVERLSDKFRTLLSNDDIKLYKHVPEFTENVPKEITKIFRAQFEDLMPEDINKITGFDPLPIPPGIITERMEDYPSESFMDDLPDEEDENFLSLLEEEEGGEDLRLSQDRPTKTKSSETLPLKEGVTVPQEAEPEQEQNSVGLDTIPEEQETEHIPVEQNSEYIQEQDDAQEHVLRSGKRVAFAI
jgi:hypothetical protein